MDQRCAGESCLLIKSAAVAKNWVHYQRVEKQSLHIEGKVLDEQRGRSEKRRA
jgi:hypothetical protein